MKRLRRECVHREIDVLSHLDHANVRLRHVRIDLHFCEVVRDLENHRRLQTGGDGLANIHTARDYYAIDRRGDRAVVEISFCFIECALFDLHIRFGLVKVGHCLVEILLR